MALRRRRPQQQEAAAPAAAAAALPPSSRPTSSARSNLRWLAFVAPVIFAGYIISRNLGNHSPDEPRALPVHYAVCSPTRGNASSIITMDESPAAFKTRCIVVNEGLIVGHGTRDEVRQEWGDVETTGKGVGRNGGVRIYYLKPGQTLLPGLSVPGSSQFCRGYPCSVALNPCPSTGPTRTRMYCSKANPLPLSTSSEPPLSRRPSTGSPTLSKRIRTCGTTGVGSSSASVGTRPSTARRTALSPRPYVPELLCSLGVTCTTASAFRGDLTSSFFQADLERDERLRGRPIYLKRIDVHALWVSPAVLALLPPDLPTKVEGGEIVRDAHGRPSGIFLDNAMDYIRA